MIKIVVRENTKKPGKWDAFVDKEQIVDGATEPFCLAGRILLDRGVPAEEFAEMWHEGSTHYSLRAKVGWLATHTVVQVDQGVRFAKWNPFGGSP